MMYNGLRNEVGRYLGPTRNGVTDLGCDLEHVYGKAVLPRGRGPGIRNSHL